MTARGPGSAGDGSHRKTVYPPRTWPIQVFGGGDGLLRGRGGDDDDVHGPAALPAGLNAGRDVAMLGRRLGASEVQQGLPAGVDERVAAGTLPSPPGEKGPGAR